MSQLSAKQWSILLVDEDVCNGQRIEEVFANTPYDLCAVHSCEEAIQIIRAFGWPHLIVAERNFRNGMDGLQFSQFVRDLSDVPIIMLSERIPTKWIAQAIDDFADDYMIKPVDPEMLLSRIRRVLRRIDFVSQAVPAYNGRFAPNYPT
ncbi:MAG: response regulator transcription factor [Anaerolineales bacterium]|nr:response regulator transcription factor [Anaerolineales bacterium]MCA9964376.1 response regulator transcription factor [Anaerolineales bacterium]MCB9432867.1 response regulator transcription factor [Ardenticatenaceae bacterium]